MPASHLAIPSFSRCGASRSVERAAPRASTSTTFRTAASSTPARASAFPISTTSVWTRWSTTIPIRAATGATTPMAYAISTCSAPGRSSRSKSKRHATKINPHPKPSPLLSRLVLRSATASSFLWLVTNVPAQTSYSITDLGTHGRVTISATATNDNGQVVGYSDLTDGGSDAVLFNVSGAKQRVRRVQHRRRARAVRLAGSEHRRGTRRDPAPGAPGKGVSGTRAATPPGRERRVRGKFQ